jgi:acyl-coenzyme A thioesterase PaaI-like protein|tara:strand:- start:1592 stop:1993 length:402 start_codon:yes stop_codon:yes gene_type:complete
MNKFEQISIHPGFMKHNGGLFFKVISETESQFKTTINENHLNRAGITHGGYIASIIDAGIGTGVHRTTSKNIFVTISLDIKFIGSSKIGDEIIGKVKIEKITNSLVFASCKLECEDKIIASASGVWKKTAKQF